MPLPSAAACVLPLVDGHPPWPRPGSLAVLAWLPPELLRAEHAGAALVQVHGLCGCMPAWPQKMRTRDRMRSGCTACRRNQVAGAVVWPVGPRHHVIHAVGQLAAVTAPPAIAFHDPAEVVPGTVAHIVSSSAGTPNNNPDAGKIPDKRRPRRMARDPGAADLALCCLPHDTNYFARVAVRHCIKPARYTAVTICLVLPYHLGVDFDMGI